MEHEGDGETSCKWCTWDDTQRLCKRVRRVGNRRVTILRSNYSIVEVGQNTEKSPRDLKKLGVI